MLFFYFIFIYCNEFLFIEKTQPMKREGGKEKKEKKKKSVRMKWSEKQNKGMRKAFSP